MNAIVGEEASLFFVLFVFSLAGQQLRADDSLSMVAASMAPSSAEALSESGYSAVSDAGSQPLSVVESESVMGGKCHSPFQLALYPGPFSHKNIQDELRYVAMS